MPQKLKKFLSFAFKVGITFLIFYFLIEKGRVDFKRLLVLWESPALFFALTGILLFITLPLTALRWWILLKGLQIQLPIGQAIWLTWIGNFFNSTLPGAVSGDLVKGYYLLKVENNGGKTSIVTSLLVDRLTGLFGLICMAFGALMFNLDVVTSHPLLHTISITISLLFIAVIVFYLILALPIAEEKDPFIKLFQKMPAGRLLNKLYTSMTSYREHKGILFGTLIIAIVTHASILWVIIWISKIMLDAPMEISMQAMLAPIGLIATAIPIAPGGIGVGHAAFDGLYHLAGVNGGADIFNLFIVVQMVINLIGSVPYFLYRAESKVPPELQ